MHSPLLFNNANVTRASFQKHLGIMLDTQLKFDDHLKMMSGKISNTIGLTRKLRNVLRRAILITLYEAFFRPNLHYDNILYDQTYKILNRFSIMPAWP